VFFVKVRLVNWKGDITIQQRITTQDGRIVQASPPVGDSYRLHRGEVKGCLIRERQRPDNCMPRNKSEGQIRNSKMHHLRI
jgi:hypothetical protein